MGTMSAALLFAAVVGIASQDLMVGAAFSARADEHFPLGGLARVPIAVEILHRIDEGRLQPEPALQRDLERMMAEGDAAALGRLRPVVEADSLDTATPQSMLDQLVDVVKRREGLSDASYRKLERWLARKIPGEPNEAIIDGSVAIVVLTKEGTEDDVVRADWGARAQLAPYLPRQTSDAVIGVAAKDLFGGAGWRERCDEHYPLGELARIPIAVTAMRRLDKGTLPHDVEPLIERMLRDGDAAATARLLCMVGARTVNRRMAAIGAAAIRVDRDTTTPQAMETLLLAIIKGRDGLSEASNQRLERWLETAKGADTREAMIVDGLQAIVILTKNAKSPPADVARDVAAVEHFIRGWLNPPVVAPSPGLRR